MASLIHIQLYIHTGSQLIIDTHVEEICTLCSEECTSSSLLVLRLEMYIYIYIYILGLCDNENSPITIIQPSITIMPYILEVQQNYKYELRTLQFRTK